MSEFLIENEGSAITDCQAFCDQNDIAWLEVMTRFNHNKIIYKTALDSFIIEIGVYKAQLAEKDTLSDYDLLKPMMHTLKGIASSLGFYPISNTAENIEPLLARGCHSELLAQCDLLKEHMIQAEYSVPLLITLLDKDIGELSMGTLEASSQSKVLRMKEELELLLEEIQSNKMHSINTLHDMEEDLCRVNQVETQALSNALNNLQFRDAQQIVEKLLVLEDG